MATRKKTATTPEGDGAYTATEWDKIIRTFNKFKTIAITPYNARTIGARTTYDDLFIGARVALEARLKENGEQSPLTLAKQSTGRMAVAVQQAQYVTMMRDPQ